MEEERGVVEEVECGEVSDDIAGGRENAFGGSEWGSEDSSPPTKVDAAADAEVELGAGPAAEPLPSVAPLPLCS